MIYKILPSGEKREHFQDRRNSIYKCSEGQKSMHYWTGQFSCFDHVQDTWVEWQEIMGSLSKRPCRLCQSV